MTDVPITSDTPITSDPGRRGRHGPGLTAVRHLSQGIGAVGVKELRGRMRGRRAFVILTIYLVLGGFRVDGRTDHGAELQLGFRWLRRNGICVDRTGRLLRC